MPGRGNLFWTERTAKAFGELELGLSWEKDQGWVDRKNRVSSSGWGWWPHRPTEEANLLLRSGLKTCRDLERVMGMWWGEDHKHMVIGANDVALSIWLWAWECPGNFHDLGIRRDPISFHFSHPSPYGEQSSGSNQLRPSVPDFSLTAISFPLNYSWALNNTGLNGAGLLICICFQEWILSSHVICIWLNLKILNHGFWTTSDKRLSIS